MPFHDDNAIPESFWSFETGEPFKNCSVCGSNLIAEKTPYLIEKAYKKEEVLFEYAMCWNCRESMMKELSEKSLKLLANYFNEHVDIESHQNRMLEQHGLSPEGWLSRCLIKDTPIRDAGEHHICGHFWGNNIEYSLLPYAICDKAIEEIVALLSDQTLGYLEDVSDKLFGIDLPQKILIL